MAERKKFIDVEIPILEKSVQVLGTTKDLHNKTIKMDLSRQMRGKGLTLTLQILNQDEKLVAYPRKFELTKSYLRRIIRKRTDNVEDSFKTATKDTSVTLKPFLITRKRVSRAVRRNLRNTTKEFLVNYARERTYLELCRDILENNLQKELLPKLKKVYPLAFCDLRVVETSEVAKIDFNLAEIEPSVEDASGDDAQADQVGLEEDGEEDESEDSGEGTEEEVKEETEKVEDNKESEVKESASKDVPQEGGNDARKE